MSSKVQFSGQGGEQAGQLTPPASVPDSGAAPQNVSEVTTQETPSKETGYLTADQARQLFTDVLSTQIPQILEKSRRETQSQTAKAESRIKEALTQQIALLQKAGVVVGPEQTQAIEKAIRAQQGQSTDVPSGSTDAHPETDGNQELDAKQVSTAHAIMDAFGVDILEDDPEVSLLDNSSEKAFNASIAKAILAKQTRLATNPAARVPGGGGQPSTSSVTDHMTGTETMEYAFSKLFKGK